MRWQRHHTLWTVLALGGVANTMFRRGLGSILVPLRGEFGLTYSQVSLVAFVPIVTYALVQVPAGHLGDRYGRGQVLLGGSLLGAGALALAGAAPSFASLVALLALVGLGEGTLFGNDRPLIAVHSPAEQQGTGQALTMASAGMGTLIGVLGAGLIAERFGWRSSFLLFATPAVAFAWAVRRWIFPLPTRAAVTAGSLVGPGLAGWRGVAAPRLLTLYAAGLGLSFINWFLGTWGPALFLDAGVPGVSRASAFASAFGLALLGALPVSGVLIDRLSGIRSRAWLLAGFMGAAVCLVVGLGLGMGAALRPVVLLGIAIGVMAFAASGWPPLYVLLSAEAAPQRLGLTYGLANTVWQGGAMSAPVIGGWLRDTTGSFAGGCYLSAELVGAAAVGVLLAYGPEAPRGGP
jgi:MFS family permease